MQRLPKNAVLEKNKFAIRLFVNVCYNSANLHHDNCQQAHLVLLPKPIKTDFNFKKDLIPLLACYVLEAANFVPLALEDGLRLTNAALEK